MEHWGDYIAFMLHVEESLERGAEIFLATILMVYDDEQHELQDILVVAEYEDVFEALKRSPPARGDAPTIELGPGTILASRAPYRLAPAEMMC